MTFFENMVLRRLIVPKREELTGKWRKLHNEKINDLYSSPNMIWVIKTITLGIAEHLARMVERRVEYRDLVAKHEGKNQLDNSQA